jgi:ankyrin repeat protein
MRTIFNNKTEAMKLLVEKNAEINIKEATWGYSALLWAAYEDNLFAIGYLLEKGANINV